MAIIMFIFSASLTFGMYYIQTIYASPTLAMNYGLANVTAIATTWSSITGVNNGQSPNPALLFGDFIVGLTVVFNLLSGASIVAALSVLPMVDASIKLLVQIIYGSASIALWVYVVANRSI